MLHSVLVEDRREVRERGGGGDDDGEGFEKQAEGGFFEGEGGRERFRDVGRAGGSRRKDGRENVEDEELGLESER